MPIEIKEIVVKTQIESTPSQSNPGLDENAIKMMMEKLKEDIMNEVSIAIFNQINKNTER